jgi:hypothetical protein
VEENAQRATASSDRLGNGRIAGDNTKNVAPGDPIESQALDMAYRMTEGIIQHFPTVFTS